MTRDIKFENLNLSTTESLRVKTNDSEICCELVGNEAKVNGVVLIEKSKWDTEHFGFGVGKLKLAYFENKVGIESRRELFEKAKAMASSQDLDVIFSRIPSNDFLTIQALEAEGAILTDFLLTFSKDLNETHICQNKIKGVRIVQASLKDEEELMNIAREVFRIDHFHADTRLPREKSDEIYARWISNSLNGLANSVFVAKRSDVILGFATFKIKTYENGGQKGVIDLIGVRNEYKECGIASFLLSKSLEWFSKKTKYILVGTQAANIPAVRLYQRMGFKYAFSEVTLHLWVSPSVVI